jgi:small subunit ribosomal protein S1
MSQLVSHQMLSKNPDERRFSLSRKAFLRNLQGEELREYIGNTEPQTTMAAAFSIAQAALSDNDGGNKGGKS